MTRRKGRKGDKCRKGFFFISFTSPCSFKQTLFKRMCSFGEEVERIDERMSERERRSSVSDTERERGREAGWREG